jgi:hypothetical protein
MKTDNLFDFGHRLFEDIEKDILKQEKEMDKISRKVKAEEKEITGNLPEIGDKFGDYQEIIEHVLDASPSWKFMNITQIGSSISKFYFVSKHGDLIMWVKPCDEGLVITKVNVRQFDHKMIKSVEYFG